MPSAATAPVAAAPAPPSSRVSRWARYTGMIESRITSTATAFTIGSWFGREKLLRIQIGSVSSPAPTVNVVTMISSNDSANASSAAGDERRAHVGERHQPEGLPRAGAEVGRGLLERARQPAQPRDHVVVDDHDAEGRVRDHDREQAEVDAEDLGERRVQRDTGDDPRQRDREDHQERDRLAPEEPVPRHRDRGERAEDQRQRGRQEPGLDASRGRRRGRRCSSSPARTTRT